MSVDTLTLRWSGILLGILFIAAMLSACGDSDGSAPQTTSSTPQTTSSTPQTTSSTPQTTSSAPQANASGHGFNASDHACRWQSGSERQYGFHVSRRLHSMVFR